MSIFKGPGILLNPATVQQPAHLPKLFDLTLAAKGANLCAVRDELGAIAHSLHENNKPDEASQLFGILESEHSLVQQRDKIFACIEHASPIDIICALDRSARYFKADEEPQLEVVGDNKFSEMDIFAALCKHNTQRAAARILGISQSTLAYHIVQATENSALGIFKKQPRITEDTIATALAEHGTQTAAAETLGVSHSTISRRVAKAPQGSDLANFKTGRTRVKRKSTRRRGRISDDKIATTITNKETDDEIAAALAEHGTQTAAAETLRVSHSTISRRVAEAKEDSPLAAFKNTFRRGRIKGIPHQRKVSDEVIAAVLARHATLTEAAPILGMHISTISQRIAKAAEDSALAVFKGTFKRGRNKKTGQKASAEEIAAALAKHGTQTATARALSISRQTVSKRIKLATKDSPLFPYKG